MNAVFVWGLSRALGGRVVLRVEDHDRGRCRPEYERSLLDDLDWLGLAADEPAPGELRAGASGFRQSDCGGRYAAVLQELAAADSGTVYPCVCSRRDLAAAFGGSERAAPNEETPYPGTCRTRALDPALTLARRVYVPAGTEMFDDVSLGPQEQEPARQCGDLLARDRTGNWTYQFAVVVDDIAHSIDVVIRGVDLLGSTGRQLALARRLGRKVAPVFLHHPLALGADGRKLSKSGGATGIRDLRRAGWTPERVLGEAARLGGLQASARSLEAGDLHELFQLTGGRQ